MARFDANSITHRRILNISLPIVLSNATIPILGAVDTGVVGQLGEAAPIGAVGIGAAIFSTLYGFFLFLRMGTSGLTSQARGRSDWGEVSAMLLRSILFGLAFGLILIVLQGPVFSLGLWISPASEEVERLANQYLVIRVYSTPAAIAIFGMTGWLIATERTRSVLVLQVLMNGLNIVLDVVFVLILSWGVPGVALATVIAEWSAFALGLYLCRDIFSQDRWFSPSVVLDRVKILNMFRVNSDIMIRTVLLMLSINSFLFLAADFSDVTLAANQVLMQLMFIAIFAIDGFSFSAEALVGVTTGYRELAALRRVVLLVSIWGMGLAVITTLCVLLLGPLAIDIMARSEDVRIEARVYLYWMAAVLLIGTPSWLLDGIFIGAVRSRDMRNSMIISFLIYCLMLAIALPGMQNHGLWLSWIVMLVARAVTLALRYPGIERDMSH